MLGELEFLGDVKFGVGEVRSAKVVAAGVAELAVDGRIATGAGAGAGIDNGDKGVRVEPLQLPGWVTPETGDLR